MPHERERPGKRDVRRAGLQLWAEKDLNLRRRKPAGLQPAPIGRSGTDPYVACRIIAVQWHLDSSHYAVLHADL
jgi:hypothetical protein